MKRPLLVLLAILLTSLPAFAEEAAPQLSVHGQAQLEVPADQAHLSLAVVTTARTSEAALRQNSATLKAVAAALAKAGLKKGESESGRFEVRPQWTPRPANPAAGWRPAITGYTVQNSLRITTGNLQQLGAYIEAAIQAGANSVEGLSFDLADASRYRDRAIAQATRDARRDAEVLAEAAGVKLEQVVSAQLDSGGYVQPRMMAFAKASAVPLTPGTVSVSAGVTLVYRIGAR